MNEEQIFQDIIGRIQMIILDFGISVLGELEYYPGCCPSSWTSKDISYLSMYLSVLEEHRRQVRLDMKPCLSEEAIKKLVGKAKVLAGTSKCQTLDVVLHIDPAPIEWTINNPNCTSYENWERCITDRCNVDYDISLMYTALSKTSGFDVIATLDLVQELKNSVMKIDIKSIDDKDCYVDFKVFTRSYPECSVSYTTYKKIVACGIKSSLISKLADCNIFMDYNKTLRCPTIELGETSVSVCEVVDIPISLT